MKYSTLCNVHICSTVIVRKSILFSAVILSKIVVIGGSYSSVKINDVEALDLSGEGKECPSLPDYPLEVTHLTATFLNNKIVACGGWDPYSNQCFELASDLTEWVEIESLLEELSSTASSNIDGKWFITGGFTPPTTNRTSVFDGSTFSRGEPLPTEKDSHCQVTLDDNNIFITAGGTQDTFMLDWAKQTYTILDDIPKIPNRDMDYPTCGLINNLLYGPEVLVALRDANFIYSLANASWKDGPPLPEYTSDLIRAQITKGVVAIGGTIAEGVSSKVYVFDDQAYEWKLQEQELKVARKGAAAIAVPDDFLKCN